MGTYAIFYFLCLYSHHVSLSVQLAGLFGQPCMVLQERYFQILDMNQLEDTTVSIDNVVKEIPLELYNAGKFNCPDAFIRVHEVAFDSKGKRSCNLSL